MDFSKIIARIKAMLATPKTEWPVVAVEPASVQGLYAGYIAIVAAFPVVAGFIKGSLIGTTIFGLTVRTPIGMGIVGMVLQYVMALAIAYVVALIINALAPTFGGQKDMVQALKTVAYAWTASWVAGIAVIIPWLGWLIALAGGIYSIYLLYLGLPHTMKCPPEKAAGYTAVSVLIAVVLSWIVGMIVAGVIGTAALSGAAMSRSSGNNVTFDSNSTLGKLAEMGQRMEQAGKEVDAARKSGDSNAQSDAMGKMMGAMSGSDGPVEALAPSEIKAFLPESLGSLKRTSISAERNGSMGMQISEASAKYAGDSQNITLEISDAGGAKGFMAMASMMAPESEKQTEYGYERSYNEKGNMFQEKWNSRSQSGSFSVTVGQRFTVKARGNVDNIDQLKKAVASVDLRKLESMKNVGVK